MKTWNDRKTEEELDWFLEGGSFRWHNLDINRVALYVLAVLIRKLREKNLL